MMELRSGARLRSGVSTVEVVVVKAPAGDVDLRCGGVPMVPQGAEPPKAGIVDGFDGPSPVGKRYAAPDSAGLDGPLELMVTKGGDGLLSLGEVLLERKDAKPLPSSD